MTGRWFHNLARRSDTFNHNVALSYSPFRGPLARDLVLELNGESKQKQEAGGFKDPNSGGNVILLSPGTRIAWKNRWAGFLSIGFPVEQDLNGIQADLDYGLFAGLSAAF